MKGTVNGKFVATYIITKERKSNKDTEEKYEKEKQTVHDFFLFIIIFLLCLKKQKDSIRLSAQVTKSKKNIVITKKRYISEETANMQNT